MSRREVVALLRTRFPDLQVVLSLYRPCVSVVLTSAKPSDSKRTSSSSLRANLMYLLVCRVLAGCLRCIPEVFAATNVSIKKLIPIQSEGETISFLRAFSPHAQLAFVALLSAAGSDQRWLTAGWAGKSAQHTPLRPLFGLLASASTQVCVALQVHRCRLLFGGINLIAGSVATLAF